MKIRTDFVTNSSSSSFILKENIMSDIQEYALNHKEQIMKDESLRNEEDFQELYDTLCSLEVRPIRDHFIEDIEETAAWYEDKIYRMIFPDYPLEEDYKNQRNLFLEKRREYWKQCMERKIPEEAWQKLAGLLVLWMICSEYEDTLDQTKDRLSAASIESKLRENAGEGLYSRNPEGEWMLPVLDLEKTIVHAQSYANKKVGQILEEILEAEYMYFYEFAAMPEALHVVERFPECILVCCHMG